MDPCLKTDKSGCKLDYEDSDGDIRLENCAPVVLEVLEEKCGVKFEKDWLENWMPVVRRKKKCSENRILTLEKN